jgi:uncharacterized membrane protein
MATWKPAPPREAKEASRAEWLAWGAAVVAALLLLTGTVRLWQVGDMPADMGVPYLGSAIALMLLGVVATIVAAAGFVVVAIARRP